MVFTHGSQGGKADMEAVDYGGVRNVLAAVGDRPARIVLMTLIGITNRSTSYNRSTEGPDWKRRSERLVRASGKPYTIVRPAGSTQRTGREQTAPAAGGPPPLRWTERRWHLQKPCLPVFWWPPCPPTPPRGRLSSSCAPSRREARRSGRPVRCAEPDGSGRLDAVHDEPNLPLDREPQRVRNDLNAVEGAGRT